MHKYTYVPEHEANESVSLAWNPSKALYLILQL